MRRRPTCRRSSWEFGLYRLTEGLANIPMVMTPREPAARGGFLTLVTSLASGLLTLRKVQTADPAGRFRTWTSEYEYFAHVRPRLAHAPRIPIALAR
ncbi:MAG: hypothetical protein U0835_08235 [Isosphaeraceae bacterium]